MKDLKIDATTGDIVVAGFDLQLVDGRDQVAQRLRTRLKTILGEWFLDTDVGVPYFEQILVKAPDLDLIGALLSQQVLADSEITGLTSAAVDYNNSTRKLTYKITAATIFGNILIEEG